MGMVKKSITVTSQQEEWIQTRVASGNYASDSEVLRDLIRTEQERDKEIEAIRAELIKAEGRGFSKRSARQIVDAVIERKRKNGRL